MAAEGHPGRPEGEEGPAGHFQVRGGGHLTQGPEVSKVLPVACVEAEGNSVARTPERETP